MHPTKGLGPLWRSFWAALVVICWLGAAEAKPLPLTVGGQVGYRSAHQLRLLGHMQWSVTETVSLRATGGPSLLSGPIQGTVIVGPALTFDVYTWVPSLYLLGGISARDVRPLVQLGAELKRYVSLHTAMTLNVAGEWMGERDFGVFVSLGAVYTP